MLTIKVNLLLLCCVPVIVVCGQPLKDNLAKSVAQMEADPQFRHAIIGIYVVERKTGKTIFEHNGQVGLAPASTQKIFTSCAAFDLLGNNYRYATEIGYNTISTAAGTGNFIIKGSGDPSFGSARFAATKPMAICKNIVAALREKKIITLSTSFAIYDTAFGKNIVPGGWIWEDIGNYYGAAAQSFNWRENQYDVVLKSGNILEERALLTDKQPKIGDSLANAVTVAAKGTGDNTIVYLPYGRSPAFISGTIPAAESAFAVGASITDPAGVFMKELEDNIKAQGIRVTDNNNSNPGQLAMGGNLTGNYIQLYKNFSPPFDSLNYWFLKKSINLYGEAFLKTMAVEKTGVGSTEKGVALLKEFWLQRGIEKAALNICDGSGLSPQNRVTANALVSALQYANTRNWFNSFYAALPLYNGMKMKSGSISGARAYAGYHTAQNGTAYTYAIIVNNYDGSAGTVVKKIFLVLDNLK
ncbi:MAG: D-alanyl-D-alanine carboxypeptidase/D-alanyl-D-alanine-endopeptidase [Chitinophagaceae bacterium]